MDSLHFESVDVRLLPERGEDRERFGEVLMMHVTEHVDDDPMRDFIGSAGQILKADGELIIHAPNVGYLFERLRSRGVFLKQLPGILRCAANNTTNGSCAMAGSKFRA